MFSSTFDSRACDIKSREDTFLKCAMMDLWFLHRQESLLDVSLNTKHLDKRCHIMWSCGPRLSTRSYNVGARIDLCFEAGGAMVVLPKRQSRCHGIHHGLLLVFSTGSVYKLNCSEIQKQKFTMVEWFSVHNMWLWVGMVAALTFQTISVGNYWHLVLNQRPQLCLTSKVI